MRTSIQLTEELSTRVKELANEMGMTEDEVVQKILEWYFEDNEK